jgi:aspartate carbamoyltransferase
MRSLTKIGDLSIDEQMSIYRTASELKHNFKKNYKIENKDHVFYLLFLEDSTRTKESFRGAVEFLGGQVRIFDSQSSSFNKKETLTDTVKMLAGYATGPVTFIIRSRQEGVCRWLADCQDVFPNDVNFVNAGDGKHEHPTQELLDEFSFLELLDFNVEKIHIALIGDLLNGRTVHSKVDGLGIFHKVKVDLVAPPELSMPLEYLERMRMAGYEVREFAGLKEYLDRSEKAPIFYFTRLQLERMSEAAKAIETKLREATSFKDDWCYLLPEGCKFFHPLPRYGLDPEIPFSLDRTSLNAWDTQSRNGYFVRIALLKWLAEHKDVSTLGCEEISPKLRCHNENCISLSEPHQVSPCFVAQPRNAGCFACRYCEKLFCLT